MKILYQINHFLKRTYSIPIVLQIGYFSDNQNNKYESMKSLAKSSFVIGLVFSGIILKQTAFR